MTTPGLRMRRRDIPLAVLIALLALASLWMLIVGLTARRADADTGAPAVKPTSSAAQLPAPAEATPADPAPAPSQTAPTDPPAPAPAPFDGRTLGVNGAASSPGGRYSLVMQDDGNLVLSQGSSPVWASGTGGGPAVMTVGDDGNLTVADVSTGAVRWSTGTGDQGASSLAVQDDGNLVLYSAAGKATWDRRGGDLVHPRPAPSEMQAPTPKQAPSPSDEPSRDQPAGDQSGSGAPDPAPVDDSFEGRVRAAVASLPGGGSAIGGITFTNYPGRSDWATTNLATCQVWIGSNTPANLILDVVRHEYGHVLQCRAYGGDSDAVVADSGGMAEVERIADAIAMDLGASWVNYTHSPTEFEWRAAESLLAGQRIS